MLLTLLENEVEEYTAHSCDCPLYCHDLKYNMSIIINVDVYITSHESAYFWGIVASWPPLCKSECIFLRLFMSNIVCILYILNVTIYHIFIPVRAWRLELLQRKT